MSLPGETTPAKRRLILCCDGTWNTPDRYGHAPNVVRLVRPIKSCSAEGLSQIVYYHPGVGTGNIVDHWIGGGTGIGLSENVRSAYALPRTHRTRTFCDMVVTALGGGPK
jgi:uncharacterized protein (DUF2235 family)